MPARAHLAGAALQLPTLSEGRRAAKQQQQQSDFTSTAAAAAAGHSAAAAAPSPERKPSQRELELLLQAELRVANEAMCTVAFPGGQGICHWHGMHVAGHVACMWQGICRACG